MATTIGFDTATEETVVGAMVGEEVAFEFRSEVRPGTRPAHSVELMPAIEQAAEAVGGWAVVDRVAVGLGPGTYTGLRVAVATARGLALSGPVGVVGVPTLAALARSMTHPVGSGGARAELALPVIDAKRGELFFGAWDRSGDEVAAASVGPPDAVGELVDRLGTDVQVAGPGALRFRSELIACGLEPAGEDDPANRLRGSAICELANLTEDTEGGEELEPIYLRKPDAERWTGSGAGEG